MKITKKMWVGTAIIAGVSVLIFCVRAYRGKKAKEKVSELAAAAEKKEA